MLSFDRSFNSAILPTRENEQQYSEAVSKVHTCVFVLLCFKFFLEFFKVCEQSIQLDDGSFRLATTAIRFSVG
jgi:hypothetical protein